MNRRAFIKLMSVTLTAPSVLPSKVGPRVLSGVDPARCGGDKTVHVQVIDKSCHCSKCVRIRAQIYRFAENYGASPKKLKEIWQI